MSKKQPTWDDVEIVFRTNKRIKIDNYNAWLTWMGFDAIEQPIESLEKPDQFYSYEE